MRSTRRSYPVAWPDITFGNVIRRDALFGGRGWELIVSLRDRVADLPADLESLIMRCLAKAPGARVQDVEELAAALLATTCSGQWSSTQAKAWWQAHAQPADAPDSDLGNPG